MVETREHISKLGKMIKDARLKKDLSQRKLAKQIGFHHSIISRWESGKNAPSGVAILRLVDEIGLKVRKSK